MVYDRARIKERLSDIARAMQHIFSVLEEHHGGIATGGRRDQFAGPTETWQRHEQDPRYIVNPQNARTLVWTKAEKGKKAPF